MATSFRTLCIVLSLSTLGFTPTAQAGDRDVGLAVGLELRSYFFDPAYPGQLEHTQPSITFEPDLRWTSDNKKHQFVLIPFARIDGEDDERSHVDLREGYYRYIGDDFDVLVGAAKVYWGVTESRHLVDVINQSDTIEDIDDEDKLGQPMVKATFLRDWGQVELYYLPTFRERTFPGEAGRLRFPLAIDTNNAVYEDDEEELAPSFAAHYSHFIGAWDVSASVFHGTSREPQFRPTKGGKLVPLYDRITQYGVTAQYTKDAWLWKFEGIAREGQGDTFGAAVAGIEYTFFGVTESGADLGVLAEFLYDGRNEDVAPPTPLENDIFFGARYALNDMQDTSLLAGAITDLKDGSTSGLVEAQRRIGQNWKAELEGRFFTNVDSDNLLSAFSNDSQVTVRLTRYY